MTKIKIAVIGGKLQGIEAAYLAHQANWDVFLIDCNRAVPAKNLSDQFFRLDVLSETDKLVSILKSVDFIVPALENENALEHLEKIAKQENIPIACDLSAYQLTASKIESDRLFQENDIPAPLYWPGCNFPLIAKPSNQSGSKGVKKINDFEELNLFLQATSGKKNNYIIQQFLEGEQYSLEVIGKKGDYNAFEVTDLEVDAFYDCKRVTAPTKLSAEQIQAFRDLSLKIADLISLSGIMDVEAIEHEGTLKVLEIDARLPSQTPTVVYKSTGINFLKLLYELYTKGKIDTVLPSFKKGVVYEHIFVTPKGVETLGEHIVAQAGYLSYFQDFFGADEALSDFLPGKDSWTATLIITADTRFKAWEKRCQVISNITDIFVKNKSEQLKK